MDNRDRKWLALVSSFVLPGLGQLYNREVYKAVAIWVVLAVALIITRPEFSASLPSYASIGGGVVVLTAYLFNVYDAYSNAGKRLS